MKQLNQRTAIITEAGQNAGKQIALYLAKLGVKVVCIGRDESFIQKTVEEIKAAGGKGFSMVCSFNDRSRMKEVMKQAAETYGTIDILINIIPENFKPISVESTSYKDMHSGWMSSTIGSLNFMQACFTYMKGQREGSIIHFIPAPMGKMESLAYACNKESIRALTRTAAREWEQYGIFVNCVCAGNSGDNAAPAIAFLSGPDSRYYSGQCLKIDGDMYSVVP